VSPQGEGAFPGGLPKITVTVLNIAISRYHGKMYSWPVFLMTSLIFLSRANLIPATMSLAELMLME